MGGTPYTVLRGVVLRETETRESDKILTVLTAERGKIPVIARGARSKRCKFAAAAQPLVWSEWSLYQKGQWYYAREGSTLELFDGLRQDLEALALGCYFAELTESVTTEEVPAEELLRHLLNGLYALANLHRPPPLVKAAFELKLLCLAGYEPLLDACAVCGVPEPEEPCLNVPEGVLCCGKCREGAGAGPFAPLAGGTLAAMRHVVYGPPKRLFSFPADVVVLESMGRACEAFLTTQLDRGFRTLDFYQQLKAGI